MVYMHEAKEKRVRMYCRMRDEWEDVRVERNRCMGRREESPLGGQGVIQMGSAEVLESFSITDPFADSIAQAR